MTLGWACFWACVVIAVTSVVAGIGVWWAMRAELRQMR